MSDELNLIVRLKAAGGDAREFAVKRMRGREAISQLFAFDIEVIQPTSQALPEELTAGAKASLLFQQDGNEVRAIHGVLEEVTLELGRDSASHRLFRLRLVPRMWRATMIETQQIFMDVSLPEIIKDKLSLVGIRGDSLVSKLMGDYPEREFIVQYRENDVQFISRLAEHLGVSFHFEHRGGSDAVVFSDHNDAFIGDIASSIQFTTRQDEPNRVYTLRRSSRPLPKLYVVCDYNYRKPDLSLLAKTQVGGRAGGVVEYGCHIKTVEEGEKLAAIRAGEIKCREHRYSGASSIPLLTAGLLTSVDGSIDLDVPLLITAVEHVVEPVDGSSEGQAAGLVYRNTFEAIDSGNTYRPQRLTPKPVISGFVTGVVMGGDGSDKQRHALIDDEGRYTVQFHFDRALGKLNTKTSRPVRKAQPFVGASEGMHFPLKPGVEVALAFAGGDPDRPVIIGALPNHVKRAVVTAKNANVNRIETSTGVLLQFGDVD